jgi:hypothetical protein
MRTWSRLAVVFVVMLAQFALLRPSWACGCGAMVASSEVDVARETSIVGFDGSREEIVMRLSTRSQARDAAWLMPTPAPARVTLGERAWFDQLDALTAPRVVRHRHWLPRLGHKDYAAAPATPRGDGVGVLRTQRLGPFEVTTLSATDARGLASWLTAHGYHLTDRLAEALTPYVEEHWKYTAIKLVPRNGSLTGDLDPLRIAFPAATPVYPIRLSRLAKTPQSVHLYVLAPHRVGVTGLTMPTTFAGRITPSQVASPGLRAMIGQGAFLTELARQDIAPANLTRDLRFDDAGDGAYRQEEVLDGGLVTFLGVPAFLWFGALGLVVLGAVVGPAVVVLVRRRRRRSSAPAVP